jgi:hypothetical protein
MLLNFKIHVYYTTFWTLKKTKNEAVNPKTKKFSFFAIFCVVDCVFGNFNVFMFLRVLKIGKSADFSKKIVFKNKNFLTHEFHPIKKFF